MNNTNLNRLKVFLTEKTRQINGWLNNWGCPLTRSASVVEIRCNWTCKHLTSYQDCWM